MADKHKILRLAEDLSVMTLGLLEDIPHDGLRELFSQLRRACVSVQSNVAEGDGRRSVREKKRFYDIALGSLLETKTQLTTLSRVRGDWSERVIRAINICITLEGHFSGEAVPYGKLYNPNEGLPNPSAFCHVAPSMPWGCRDDGVRSIYTAGPMADEAVRGAIAPWRVKFSESMEKELDRDIRVKFAHPELVGCDHTGLNPEETVKEDRWLLEKSSVVAVYLDREDLCGTIAEMFWARELGKPMVVAVHEGLLEKTGTKHACNCHMEGKSAYWFIETALGIDPIFVSSDFSVFAKAVSAVLESIATEDAVREIAADFQGDGL